MVKYFVSDSASLQTEELSDIETAKAWVNDRCVERGMEPGDWQHPEIWKGCESPPQISPYYESIGEFITTL